MESQTDQIQQIKKVIDIAFRRKMLVIGFTLLATAIGLAVYIKQPKIYQSSSLLIYQRQKVSPATMSPDVRGRIRDVTSTISQIVLSRTSLEKIIETQGLYRLARERLPMQDVVEMMRKDIQIEPSRSGDTFSITFSGKHPEIVARVTNALAARFVEENLKHRQERATETSSYTQNELDMAKETLDQKEAILRDYKLKYYNEMPAQRETNMARLNALQVQYQGKQESVQSLEGTRVLIQDQVTARKQVLENYHGSRVPVTSTLDSSEVITNQQQLDRLQSNLEILQGRYTEKHPRIKSLVKKINRLEKKIEGQDAPKTTLETGEDQTEKVHDTILFNLQLQLKEIGLQRDKIKKDMEKIQEQAFEYEQWIAAAPVREAEWSSISREYGELKRHYDFLVARNLQARSAMNLERKQKGSQFRIEDPARVAAKPISPKFLKLMGMAIMLGLGIGGGLSFGIEFINTSFRDPVSLEKVFGVEVLCSVPNIPLQREIIKRRILAIVVTSLVAIFAIALLVVAVYFWKNGQIIL